MRQEDYYEFITRPGFIAEIVSLKTKMLGGGSRKRRGRLTVYTSVTVRQGASIWGFVSQSEYS